MKHTCKRLLALLLALTMALGLLGTGAWAAEIDPEETEPSLTEEAETLTDDPEAPAPDPEPEPEPDPEPPTEEAYEAPVPEESVTDEAMGDAASHIHDSITFSPWTDELARNQNGDTATAANSLPSNSGSYYLTGNVSLSSTWTVPGGGVKLCLNGHTVTGPTSGSVISIANGRSLSLYDESGGQIVGRASGDDKPANGGGVFVWGSFTMNGGVIQNCSADNGGGVFVWSGSFTMNNGTIQNCSADNGGGVDNRAAFTMNGGAIKDCSCNGSYGGGAIWAVSPTNLYGGTISGCGSTGYAVFHANSPGATTVLHIKGNPQIWDNNGKNILLQSDYQLAVDGTLTGGNGTIGVNALSVVTGSADGSPIRLTSGLSGKGSVGIFKSDNAAYAVTATTGNEAQLVKAYTVTYDANDGSGNTVTESYPSGATVTVKDNPFTRNGYTFDGWKTQQSGGTSYAPQSTFSISGNTTLYAKWIPIEAKIPDVVAITSLTEDDALTYGYTSGSITVTASTDSDHTLSYQWYSRISNQNHKIDGATDATYNLPTGLAPGSYNYFCVVTATRENGMSASRTSYTWVTVNRANPSADVTMSGYTYGGNVSTPAVTANPGNAEVTYYYSAANSNQNGTKWENMTGTTLNAGTWYLYAEIAESDNYNAWTTAPVPFTIDNGAQSAPAAPEKDSATTDSITLKAVDGCEYKCEDGDWQDSPEFTGLAQNTAYTFSQRYKAKQNYNPSAPATATLSTNDHVHDWTYIAAGDTITAVCTGEGICAIQDGLTLTVIAPEHLTYDGSAKLATLSAGYSATAFPGPSITYQKGGQSVDACVDAGDYTASVTVGGVTAEVSFTIAPKTVGLTWSNTSFTYDKKSHIPTAKATGLVSGDACTVTVTGAQKNAGKYTATAAKLSNGNYRLPAKNTQSFTIRKAAQTAPAAPVITKITNTGITVSAVKGLEYSIDGKHWQTSGAFTGLSMGRAYTVRARKPATANYNASPAATVQGRTLTAPTTLNMGFSMAQSKGKLTVRYGRVPGATGYRVYVQYCGKNDFTADNMVTVNSGSKTTVTITRINKAALDQSKCCKVKVEALKGSTVIGTSRINHMAGLTQSNYTNVKTIQLNKTAVTLNRNGKGQRTFTLKPIITKENSSKDLLPTGHGPRYRYATSDSSVAMVDSNGVITAKAPGTCNVFVFAQNGMSAQITVSVK